MKKLLLVILTGLGAIIGMAVPTHADSTDNAFIASLQAAGFTYSESDNAVGAGKWVCDTVKGGTQMSDVVKVLQIKNPSLSESKANTFAAIAVNAYCPPVISTGSAPSSAPRSAAVSAPSSAPVSAPSSALSVHLVVPLSAPLVCRCYSPSSASQHYLIAVRASRRSGPVLGQGRFAAPRRRRGPSPREGRTARRRSALPTRSFAE